MKTIAKLLSIAILFSIPIASFAQRDYRDNRDSWSISGTINNINNSKETFEIRDDSNRKYTVKAGDARIYDRSRDLRFRDLSENDQVRVYGYRSDSRTITADSVYILGREGRGFGYDRDSVRVFGTIKKVDKKGRKLELTVDRRTQKVNLTRDTVIYSSGNRRMDIEDLDKGDEVRVEGYRIRGNDITATAIYTETNRGWDYDRYDRNARSIQVRVVKDTSILDRRLTVTAYGRTSRMPDLFKIEVPKNTEVRRNGRDISVHEINVGEILDVDGYWNSNLYIATRVRVTGADARDDYYLGRDYRNFSGRVKDIDYRDLQFTLDTRDGERKVQADRARIWRSSDLCDFRDIRKGDEVSVRGNLSGRNIDAERIDITRGDGRIYY